MKKLYHSFIHGISINLLEWFVYHLLFMGHQLLLFRNTNHFLYGQVGATFSLLYATIAFSNLGLDSSLAPFFITATQSRQRFQRLIGSQLAGQIVLFSFGSLITLFFFPPFHDIYLALIFISAAVIEGIRKLMRVLLHLTFMHNLRIIIELFTLIIYIFMVWGYYFILQTSLSLYSIFLPFLISSLVSSFIIGFYLHRWYCSLPQTTAMSLSPNLFIRIFKMRLFTSFYTVGHQLFSGNILIPYIAFHVGFSQAGIWHLICTIINTIANLMNKISGFTSQALLAHIQNKTGLIKKKTFSIITNTLNQLIYAIIIFIIINYKKLSLCSGSPFEKQWFIPSTIFIAITIIEQLSLVYEKFYLNEERTGQLVLFNAFLIMSCLLFMRGNYSLITFLLSLFALRMISFVLIASLSYYYWGIRSNWKIQPRLLFLSIIISLFFYYFYPLC